MKPLTTNIFVERCKQRNFNVDYSNVVYQTMRTPITLHCTLHQKTFQQTPFDHLKGISSGCPLCKHDMMLLLKQNDTKTFITKAKKVHKNIYDYSLVQYVHSTYPIDIKCCSHGIFSQLPSNHLAGNGCPKCGNENTTKTTRLSTDRFVDMAKKIHKNKYNYSLVEYVNVNTPVSILCKIHGMYSIKPDYHLYKRMGCSHCSKEKYRGGVYGRGYNWKETSSGYLYVLECTNETESFIKIGISKQPKTNRISQLKFKLKSATYEVTRIICVNQFPDIKQAWELENLLLNKCKKYEPLNKFPGHTECVCITERQNLLKNIHSFAKR